MCGYLITLPKLDFVITKWPINGLNSELSCTQLNECAHCISGGSGGDFVDSGSSSN